MTDEISRIAFDEARRAAALAHDARNRLQEHELEDRGKHAELERRADKTDWDMNAVKTKVDDDCERITALEKEHAEMQKSNDKLALSVDRLARKLPPPRGAHEITREMWHNTSPKAKAGFVTVLALLLSPPAIDLVKALTQAFAQVAAIFHH
jgi:chromosome segregation ATPase